MSLILTSTSCQFQCIILFSDDACISARIDINITNLKFKGGPARFRGKMKTAMGGGGGGAFFEIYIPQTRISNRAMSLVAKLDTCEEIGSLKI